MGESVVLIGYSGHAYVICETLNDNGFFIKGYCDVEEKSSNPYGLQYLGDEQSVNVTEILREAGYIVSIGDNLLRQTVQRRIERITGFAPVSAVSKSAIVAHSARLGHGCVLNAGAIVQARVSIRDGAIINSGAIVEHECQIGAFSHIAPGSVLCGRVRVGDETLIGAGSVVLPGIQIGNKVTVGAGSLVIRDVPDGATVMGNPARITSGSTKSEN